MESASTVHNDPIATLSEYDPEVAAIVRAENKRQHSKIRLIPSENYASRAVLEATGTVLSNKYSEGYAKDRYYEGQQQIDKLEILCVDRAKQVYGAEHVNVQPYSGSPANQAVYVGLASPGDVIMGLSLAHGGHLTHGDKVSISGSHYTPVQYGVREEDGEIDYAQVEALAKEHKPKLLFCGATAYPRVVDFERFAAIGRSVGAIVVADIAHISGLVAAGVHPSPVPHVDVTTTTTHKSLRGPRGGMILTNDEAIAKKVNSAIFPGTQGGPLMHVIAAKAAAFGEALRPEFKEYSAAVVKNAQTLAETLSGGGLDIVSGGTDTHLALVDLRPKGLTGKVAEASLEAAGMTCNKNGIPFDPEKPTITSGVRLGSPAATTRGFGEAEFRQIGEMIVEVLDGLASGSNDNSAVQAAIREKVGELCARFPIYPGQ